MYFKCMKVKVGFRTVETFSVFLGGGRGYWDRSSALCARYYIIISRIYNLYSGMISKIVLLIP